MSLFPILRGVSRYHSYINSASQILHQYSGQEPFASFLKKYFSANKKFGSKDRKQVSHLCYCFFRLGKAVMNVSLEEKMLIALFLCSSERSEILEALKPEWNLKTELGLEEKCSMLNAQFSIFNVFPWKEELSGGIEYEEFCKSFFKQPDLFLRIRPGHAETVLKKLDGSKEQYEFISPFTICVPNSFKADKYLELDKEVVVQDYSSQQVGRFIKSENENLPAGRQGLKSEISLWDCCAGSGGKSIMAYDLNLGIELTVSDIRETILINLKKRFEKAGIKKYKSFVTDLTRGKSEIENLPAGRQGLKSQIIIADVPCTGSGTWSRTPEQLYFFNKYKIEEYAALQKKIITNIIPHLQPGGVFVYITCSVFKKENEEVVEFIKENFQLDLVKMPARMTRSDGEILKGYDKKADTMFVAVFKKPL